MGREFEMKFRATPEMQQAIAAAYPLAWRKIAMETTYFDTPQGDLGRLHWTLRCRLENGQPVCTVKTPAPGGGRGEWEVACGDIRQAIWELRKLGAPAELLPFAAGELQPVCAARFTRRAALLKLPDCTLELALDQGRLLGGSREEALCEVEVEVKSGSEAAAIAFAREFSRKFDLREESRSKYRRALALAKGE